MDNQVLLYWDGTGWMPVPAASARPEARDAWLAALRKPEYRERVHPPVEQRGN